MGGGRGVGFTKKQLPKKGGLRQFADLRGAWLKIVGGVFKGG